MNELEHFDAQCEAAFADEEERQAMKDSGYWCDGCGTPTPFGSKLCGGAKCFNMSAETGRGWYTDRPTTSPKIERPRKPGEQRAELRQGEQPEDASDNLF